MILLNHGNFSQFKSKDCWPCLSYPLRLETLKFTYKPIPHGFWIICYEGEKHMMSFYSAQEWVTVLGLYLRIPKCSLSHNSYKRMMVMIIIILYLVFLILILEESGWVGVSSHVPWEVVCLLFQEELWDKWCFRLPGWKLPFLTALSNW